MLNMWSKTLRHIILAECTLKYHRPIIEIFKRTNYKIVKRPDPKSLKMPKASTSGPSLKTVLIEKIKLSGGISVADYMDTVLTSPSSGYYMTRDVFGPRGDFITSPEISQLFGEMLGIWFYNEWHKIGSPKPFQIIELGPGKGSLISDIMRTINRLGVKSEFSLHLVEISQVLQNIQANRLCASHKSADEDKPFYHEGETVGGRPVFWYNDIKDVPKSFSWIIAHEFFDALPILKFKKTENGWREVRIDIDKSQNTDEKDHDKVKFRFALSPNENVSTNLFMRPPLTERGLDDVEVCPKAFSIGKNISDRVMQDGGIGLIADYGHSGTKGDTFRAFKEHTIVDPLEEPGSADLTADVDFEQLKMAFQQNLVFGPVEQGDFLKRCGMELRLAMLTENTEQKENLDSCYHLLTDKDKMGSRFKFLSIFPQVLDEHLKKFPVLGFSEESKREKK